MTAQSIFPHRSHDLRGNASRMPGQESRRVGRREFDHAVFMEDAALFASIGSIRIGNIETKRQHIRQVVPECQALLPATSR